CDEDVLLQGFNLAIAKKFFPAINRLGGFRQDLDQDFGVAFEVPVGIARITHHHYIRVTRFCKTRFSAGSAEQGRGRSGSAGFQPAVSQCFQPADAPIDPAQWSMVRSADWKSAIQQETCATPNRPDS